MEEEVEGVRIASPTVTKQTIMQTPYQNFNPVADGGQPLPNLKELKQDIIAIHAGIEEQMKSALEDPTAQANRQMLTANETTMLDEFTTGKITLSLQYANPLLAIVKKLSTNFSVVEITIDNLKARFSRPLDLSSARQALNSLIEDIANQQQQQGKKYEDVRIIIK